MRKGMYVELSRLGVRGQGSGVGGSLVVVVC